MKKLLQISLEVNSGSVGRIAEQIGETAIARGWESYITYARSHLPSKSQTIKIGTLWDVRRHGIMTRLFDRHCLSSTQATRKLIRRIDEIEPDIILLHHIHGYYLDMEVLFGYLAARNTPVVWVFHDCWSMTGHCAHFDFVGCRKWETGCYRCEQKKEYPASLLFDRSRKNYALKKKLFNSVKNMTIVPVSYWLAEIVKRSFLKGQAVRVINNGIDLDVFKPQSNGEQVRAKYAIGDRTMLLGAASTWSDRKGLRDFTELQKIVDSRTVIMLVGLTECQIAMLPEGMIGIARTENVQQLAELYSAADVFVNLTWEDTFPTTNLEALACGTPVITYKTGGSVESVSPETGFIVGQGDLQAVWQSVETIRRHGKSAYAQSCRKRAEELYDKRNRFDEYMNLFSELLNNSHGKY